VSDKRKGQPTVNVLEAEWAAANPRPHWTSDFWESCRPTHEEENDGQD
jgi:hypothetical protein